MEIIKLQQEKKGLKRKVRDIYEQPRQHPTPKYLWTRGGEYKDVLEREMPLSHLPHGTDWRVLGLYNPQTHSLIVGSDLHKGQKEHTRAHEKIHSYGFHDEITTDRIASRQDYQMYSRNLSQTA